MLSIKLRDRKEGKFGLTKKVRYVGDYYKVSLHKGSVYEVVYEQDGFYAIIDETGEEYCFPDTDFEIVTEGRIA